MSAFNPSEALRLKSRCEVRPVMSFVFVCWHKYQKYKSVELGDQLEKQVRSQTCEIECLQKLPQSCLAPHVYPLLLSHMFTPCYLELLNADANANTNRKANANTKTLNVKSKSFWSYLAANFHLYRCNRIIIRLKVNLFTIYGGKTNYLTNIEHFVKCCTSPNICFGNVTNIFLCIHLRFLFFIAFLWSADLSDSIRHQDTNNMTEKARFCMFRLADISFKSGWNLLADERSDNFEW